MGTFAVCIPTYNRAEILRATLHDLAQYGDLIDEVVVSDNASPDHTAAVVEECRPLFRSLIYFRQAENLGAVRNIHTALSITRCTYQYPLSDDDRLVPAGIRTGLDQLRSDPDAVAVYGGYRDIGEDSVAREFPIGGDSERFTKEQKLEIFQKYYLLWFPICVSEAYQRHCYSDGLSFGFWTIVDQLLNSGAIWVISEFFYDHNPTAGRLEFSLAEPWYQEFHRSDLELFLGQLKPDPEQFAQLAEFVTRRHGRIYKFARNAAKLNGQTETERYYLLRQRAYGWRAIEDEQEWEERAMIDCALARIIDRIKFSTPRRLILEQGLMNLGALADIIIAAMPSLDVVALERKDFVESVAQATDMLVAEDWRVLEARTTLGSPDDGAIRLAFGDILQMFKLSDAIKERLLLGPSGTPHLAVI